jgi:hypothetical protein
MARNAGSSPLQRMVFVAMSGMGSLLGSADSHTSLAGLIRESIFFTKNFCEDDGLPGQARQ